MLLQFRTLTRLKNKIGFNLGWGYSSFDEKYGCVLTMIGVATLGHKEYKKLIYDRSTANRVPDLLANAIGIDQNKLRQLEAGFEGWTYERGYVDVNHPQYKVGRRLHRAHRAGTF
jgi:hypothetical protein